MTREEAIEHMQQFRHQCESWEIPDEEGKEACDMAIEALKAQPCEDAVSRTEAIRLIDMERKEPHLIDNAEDGLLEARRIINTLPSVQPTATAKCPPLDKDRKCHCGFCPERPKGEWIPVTYKPMTEEEKKDYAEYTGYDIEDLDFMLDCPLPDDGETVLITDRIGNVEVDTFINDSDGCYFEVNCDMNDIKAWMPLPEPYNADMRGGQE